MSERTHGEAHSRLSKGTPEYHTWASMLSRCYTRTHRFFGRYGGRGITVCDRWRADYPAFLADMGRRPSSAHSLDRINNDGNYEPGNCRWATRREQRNNCSVSRWITLAGERMPLSVAAERLGILRETLRYRLDHGWKESDILSAPDHGRSRRGLGNAK